VGLVAASSSARVVAVSGPRSLEEIMADPNSRLSELAALLLVAGRLSRAMEAVRALPPIVDADRRRELTELVQRAIDQVDLATREHAQR
jgi:hypothetical protein